MNGCSIEVSTCEMLLWDGAPVIDKEGQIGSWFHDPVRRGWGSMQILSDDREWKTLRVSNMHELHLDLSFSSSQERVIFLVGRALGVPSRHLIRQWIWELPGDDGYDFNGIAYPESPMITLMSAPSLRGSSALCVFRLVVPDLTEGDAEAEVLVKTWQRLVESGHGSVRSPSGVRLDRG